MDPAVVKVAIIPLGSRNGCKFGIGARVESELLEALAPEKARTTAATTRAVRAKNLLFLGERDTRTSLIFGNRIGHSFVNPSAGPRHRFCRLSAASFRRMRANNQCIGSD